MGGDGVAERRMSVQDFEADPDKALDAARNGITVHLMDGERRVARVVPITEAMRADEAQITPGNGEPMDPTPPGLRLRGPGTSLDLLRESR